MRTAGKIIVALAAALVSAAVLTVKFYRESKTLDIYGGVSARPTDREWSARWRSVETQDDPRDEYGAPEGAWFFGGRS